MEGAPLPGLPPPQPQCVFRPGTNRRRRTTRQRKPEAVAATIPSAMVSCHATRLNIRLFPSRATRLAGETFIELRERVGAGLADARAQPSSRRPIAAWAPTGARETGIHEIEGWRQDFGDAPATPSACFAGCLARRFRSQDMSATAQSNAGSARVRLPGSSGARSGS